MSRARSEVGNEPALRHGGVRQGEGTATRRALVLCEAVVRVPSGLGRSTAGGAKGDFQRSSCSLAPRLSLLPPRTGGHLTMSLSVKVYPVCAFFLASLNGHVTHTLLVPHTHSPGSHPHCLGQLGGPPLYGRIMVCPASP